MTLETFAVSVSRHGDELVLTCAGELDMAGADILRPVVEREVAATPSGGCVWFDCSSIIFVDSIGIKSLLHAASVCMQNAIDFTLEPSEPMRKLLETIGAAPALSLTP
jgi:anti-anti-sigma factor